MTHVDPCDQLGPIPPQSECEFGDLRFAKLLGKQQWSTLPDAIRARFGKRLRAGESAVYCGRLLETRMSLMGTIWSQLLRVIGAPLPLEVTMGGEAAIVTVTEAPNGRDQFWVRQFNRKSGFPQIIHSIKRFAGPTGLEEGIGCGVGMTLSLCVTERSLFFISKKYFITVFGIRIYLLAILCPGKLVVGHHEMGDGYFDFTLNLAHPLFGELVSQRVRFHDQET